MSGALGLAVVIGWHTGSTGLVHVHSSFVAMQFTTALGFLFSGVGLFFLARGRVVLAIGCGTVVGAIGGLSLLEYLMDADFGIDRIFAFSLGVARPYELTRMAPNTAICFVLTALALTGAQTPYFAGLRDATLRILGSIMVAIGLIALIGHFADVESAYWRIGKIGMAVHTAAGFVALGAGFLTLSRRSWIWRVMWPRWLSGLAAAVITFLSVALWQEIDRREASFVKESLQREAVLVAGALKSAVDMRFAAFERLATGWDTAGGPARDAWRREATRAMAALPGLSAIGWLDARNRLRWLGPSDKGDAGTAETVARSIRGAYAWMVQRARRDGALQVAALGDGRNAAGTFLLAAPLPSENGVIVGAIDARAALEQGLSRSLLADYGLAIRDVGEKAQGVPVSESGGRGTFFGETSVPLMGKEWTVRIWLNGVPFARQLSRLPDAVMVTGIVVAFLIALSLNYALISRDARRIRESETRMSAILDSAGEGICGMDRQGRITFANRAATALLGFEADEMVGQSMHALVHHHYPDGQAFPEAECSIAQAVAAGTGCEVDDEVFWRKDGAAVPVEYTSRPKVDDFGRLRGAVLLFRDISERKRTEAEREDLIEKLSRSNTELDNFAHIASHDLKEPLRAIHNHSQFLVEDYAGKLEEDGVKRLHRLQFLTERMERLISDLLYYSRLGRQEISVGPTDLNAVIRDIADTMQDELSARNARIVVPRPLPTVECDGVHINTLLMNLIQNAVKYNESREKRVEIGCREGPVPVFYVKDNGIGIAPEFNEDVFRIFKRLHSDKAYGAGTGAGLTFVKKIVEQHGGKIWIESNGGEGTTFLFTLKKEKRG